MNHYYNSADAPRLQIPDIPGISLVAYYGNKPLELQQLILELQQLLKENFTTNFIPYDLQQIHATIIGCEGVKTESGIINKWFYSLRDEIRYIDYEGLLNYFLTSIFPLNLCFGGYQPHTDYQFLSRNQHPAKRSFQLQTAQDNTLIPIVIGWSLQEQIITSDIDKIRRDLQQFNCLHKYHKNPDDVDNDVYLRLGTIVGFTPEIIATIQQKVNCYLQHQKPTIVSLSKDNLAIVKYQNLSLPISTTKIYSLTDLYDNPTLIQKLYT